MEMKPQVFEGGNLLNRTAIAVQEEEEFYKLENLRTRTYSVITQ